MEDCDGPDCIPNRLADFPEGEDKMSEMVERVARASFRSYCERNKLEFVFEDMDASEMEFAMLHARACVEAMREPTEAMDEAGDMEAHYMPPGAPSRVWRQMIDEALK